MEDVKISIKAPQHGENTWIYYNLQDVVIHIEGEEHNLGDFVRILYDLIQEHKD